MIKIVCVGKVKEKFYREAIDEYLKRLSKYTKVSILEVPDTSDSNLSLKKEGAEILKKIKDNEFVITLEIGGKMVDSLEMADLIDRTFNNHSVITFVIGGSYGLSEDVLKRSNYRLSFSKLTFPHQLFRVVLLEQIYRCFKINNNESYHK